MDVFATFAKVSVRQWPEIHLLLLQKFQSLLLTSLKELQHTEYSLHFSAAPPNTRDVPPKGTIFIIICIIIIIFAVLSPLFLFVWCFPNNDIKSTVDVLTPVLMNIQVLWLWVRHVDWQTGPLTAGSDPSEKKKKWRPLAKVDRLKINRKNCQLQSDLGLFSRLRERQKHMWYSRAPGPLSDRRAPIDYTGFPLSRLVGTAGNSLPTIQRAIKVHEGRADQAGVAAYETLLYISLPLARDISPVMWHRTTQKTWMFKCHKSYAEDISPVCISINHNTHLLSGAVAQNAASDAVKCKNISWVFANWVLWRTSGPKEEELKRSTL